MNDTIIGLMTYLNHYRLKSYRLGHKDPKLSECKVGDKGHFYIEMPGLVDKK